MRYENRHLFFAVVLNTITPTISSIEMAVCQLQRIGKIWIGGEQRGKAQVRPGFTHEDAKRLVDRALQEAKSQGKVKPAQH